MKDIFLKLTINILKSYIFQKLPKVFLKRMKIQKVEKREYYRRNEYVIHLSNFKKALNHELLFRKLD